MNGFDWIRKGPVYPVVEKGVKKPIERRQQTVGRIQNIALLFVFDLLLWLDSEPPIAHCQLPTANWLTLMEMLNYHRLPYLIFLVVTTIFSEMFFLRIGYFLPV